MAWCTQVWRKLRKFRLEKNPVISRDVSGCHGFSARFFHAHYDWTTRVLEMEMHGGSSAPYLACTPCVPLFCTLFEKGVETEALLDYQGWAGDHVHCTVEPSPGHIRCRNFELFRLRLIGRLDNKNPLGNQPSEMAPFFCRTPKPTCM